MTDLGLAKEHAYDTVVRWEKAVKNLWRALSDRARSEGMSHRFYQRDFGGFIITLSYRSGVTVEYKSGSGFDTLPLAALVSRNDFEPYRMKEINKWVRDVFEEANAEIAKIHKMNKEFFKKVGSIFGNTIAEWNLSCKSGEDV